jgi:6-phosphofructokinase 2
MLPSTQLGSLIGEVLTYSFEEPTKMIQTVTCNPCVDKSFIVHGLKPEAKMHARDVRYDPGGGGINVSRVIQRFGCDTIAFGFAGGHSGHALRDLLDREGVPHKLITVKDATRINVTILDDADGAQYVFSLPGAHVGHHEWREMMAALEAYETKTAFIVLSGSLPPSLQDDAYAEVARHATERGAKVLVDSSGEPLRRTFQYEPLLVKPNRRELELLTGKQLAGVDDVLAASRKVLEMGPQSIVVSMGEKGALAVNKQGAWLAKAPPVKTISKVGAGDSMMAALVRSLRIGTELKEALKLGVAAGSAATISPGTDLCHLKDIDHLYPKVELEQL